VPLGAPRPPHAESQRDGVSWSAFGIALALLLFAAVALIVQTHRVDALSGKVDGLEAELAAAHGQLATYHAQLGLIRSSVAAVVDQVTSLDELVQADPGAVPAPEAPANSTDR
jgi:hypothetical protein